MKHQATLPNSSVGLNSDAIDIANFQEQVYKYLARKDTTGDAQAPIPKGTVDKAGSLRKAILQLSLAPDIYANARLQPKGTARLG